MSTRTEDNNSAKESGKPDRWGLTPEDYKLYSKGLGWIPMPTRTDCFIETIKGAFRENTTRKEIKHFMRNYMPTRTQRLMQRMTTALHLRY
jgi:hypothetical protein